MNEVWKPVVGYEGTYEVSCCGRIRSIPRMVLGRYGGMVPKPGKMLSLKTERNGYIRVCLRRQTGQCTMLVHRMVANAFIPNPEMLPVVNHIDGDKANNTAENLEWCTQRQNCHHALRNSIYEHARGESVSGS